MTTKHFIDAESLQQDAFKLAVSIMESGYRPTFIVGVWRGGAAIGVTVQELLAYCGCPTDHIAIRTSSYTGINARDKHIRVHGLNYLLNNLSSDDSLLLVDDVHETGLSLQEVIRQINERCQANVPKEIRIATLYYKPTKNQVDFTPDYYVHESDRWLVFPHELEGLNEEELSLHKPGIVAIKDWLLENRDKN